MPSTPASMTARRANSCLGKYKSSECSNLGRFDVFFCWRGFRSASPSGHPGIPCTELDRAIDVLIPAVRNSAKQIDQASNAQKVADAINAYADAAEQVGEDDTTAEATVGKAACGRAGSLPSSQPAA